MTSPGPSHESVVKASGVGGGDSAERRMRGRECQDPQGSSHPPSPGGCGAVESRAQGLRSRGDSAPRPPPPGPGAAPHQLLFFVLVAGIPPLLAARLLVRDARCRRWGLLRLQRSLVPATLLHLRRHYRPAARALLAPPRFPYGFAHVAHGAPPPELACYRKRRWDPPTPEAWDTPPSDRAHGSRPKSTISSPQRALRRCPGLDCEVPEGHATVQSVI